MSGIAVALGLLALAACSLWIGAGLCALRMAVGRRQRVAAQTPVSVLKPLRGTDHGLEDNLGTFFRQSHPNFQLVFGVECPIDPALAVVRRLQQRYPQVDAKIVLTTSSWGLNPKVRNLRGMLRGAKHDLILISDSNIAAPTDYLEEMVGTFQPRAIGLVTSVVAGVGDDGWGARLDAVQLNGFVAAGSTLPTLVGHAAVLGKSMLMSRRQFDAIGGFAAVGDVLAEDFVIGKLFQRAGYRVVLGQTVLWNVTDGTTLGGFFRRHLRWSMMRSRLRPWAYGIEPLISPTVLLPIAWLCMGPAALVWWAAMVLLRDLGGWLTLRGRPDCHWAVLLAVPRELLMLAVWVVTPFVQHVAWRGHRLRVGLGTRLEPIGRRQISSVCNSTVAGRGARVTSS